MNKKTLPLFAALLCFAPDASAEDLTNPFYMPLKGKGYAKTSFSYAHSKAEREGLPFYAGSDTSDDSVFDQSVYFGLTDRFALLGGVGNIAESSGDKDTLFWKIGGRYAFFFEHTPELLMQTEISYGQKRGGDKRIDATLSVGYDAGATVLPYAELGVFTPLEQGKDNNESKYALRLGAYSVIKEQVGVRAGLDAYFDHEHGNYQSYSLFAEGEYVLSPSMTVSLTAGYLLHDTFKYDAGVRTSSFTIGAGFKAAF